MSKRRINKQQSARILKIQERYRDDNESLATEDGLVLMRFGRTAQIEDKEGRQIHCSIRPSIDSLVAGDRVIWRAEGENSGVVVSRYTRDSMLGRPDKRGEFKPVAANITQIIVVVAPKPELTWSLLDSYLVMAEQLALSICIVLNKTDLDSEWIKNELTNCYEPLGYPVLFASSKSKTSYDLLKQQLNNQTSVFVGQSGVGKSSLIAGLLPHIDNIQTADISIVSELGCHTTSNSRLYHLPSGGALIDSPGVREFGLWHLPVAEITKGYREFRPLIRECKFRNCNHKDNPGCAIIQALDEKHLTQRRYESYLKLVNLFGQ
jgi:ribosome biogenesis GTPase